MPLTNILSNIFIKGLDNMGNKIVNDMSLKIVKSHTTIIEIYLVLFM